MDKPPLGRDGRNRSSSMDSTYACPVFAEPVAAPSSSSSSKRSRSRTSSFSREMSDVNVSRLPAAPQLPSVPYPVDPYHFSCHHSVDTKDAVAEVMRSLNRHDVDLVFQVHKCKFKCVKYVAYDRIDFNIRLYRAETQSLLIECQRRSGSLLAWDTLYRDMYCDLCSIIDRSAPTCAQSGGQKKVLLETPLIAPSRDPRGSTSSGMDVFVIMLTSHFVDIRAEGCSAVAAATRTLATAHKAATCGLIALLSAQIQEMSGFERSTVLSSQAPIVPSSVRRDIVRCAVGAIANMALAYPSCAGAGPHITEQFQSAWSSMLHWLKATSTDEYTLKELQREVCRAVVPLLSLLPTAISARDKSILLAFVTRAQSDVTMTSACTHLLDAITRVQNVAL
ncbi:hypothetical protein SDRG_09507 [Saprolegnia diclina VS20]|uniref:Uncharacterized protein n=1 Tax=Saprolegnia diclina (strain VS20) TaxID=1156394 RepID=T0Q592_SAPDV|nr:hypothetical protein SDRG_09507 [Saprolegnia diclina VS20]EQC32984.1 hypothetical protein SDRG_09507 [Saprolegnia diclina VS20]|eukprot:XP_008613670.1 hypothetical protein SDRG_09507 [Saprolegnia diclina VS20]